MDALSLYRAGELKPAIEALGNELRKQPLDAKRRTFLFEMLCFAGEYDRAEKQLNVLSDTSKEAAAGTLLYRSALHAERTRQGMFERGELPLGSALKSPSGTLNGSPFESLTDGDSRIGANLEVFIAGSYTWVPFAYIESLTIAAPTKLRDLLWAPALLQATPSFRLQDLGEVLLPAIAPLSWKRTDDNVRLGRSTVWEQNVENLFVPFGQKVLLIQDDEQPFLEIRNLKFDHSGETQESATS